MKNGWELTEKPEKFIHQGYVIPGREMMYFYFEIDN